MSSQSKTLVLYRESKKSLKPQRFQGFSLEATPGFELEQSIFWTIYPMLNTAIKG